MAIEETMAMAEEVGSIKLRLIKQYTYRHAFTNIVRDIHLIMQYTRQHELNDSAHL